MSMCLQERYLEMSLTTNPVTRSCSLEITGKALDPSEVSLKLREVPDRSFKRGDNSPHGHPRFLSVWSVESDRHVSSSKIDDHLGYIIKLIKRRKLRIIDLRRTLCASVRVRIFWDFDETISLAINKGELKSLTDVVDGIDISIT